MKKKELQKFEQDMSIIKESLRQAYGPHTKKEKFSMFMVNVFWVSIEILAFLAFISACILLIKKSLI